MSKTDSTKRLEKYIWQHCTQKNNKPILGTYSCHEVGIGRKRLKHGIVDFLLIPKRIIYGDVMKLKQVRVIITLNQNIHL